VGQDLTGVQAAGVANYAGRDVSSVQAAGVINLTRGRLSGAQVAGMTNLALGGFSGVQHAGLVNVAGEDVQGAQVGGVFSYAQDLTEGAQVSGVANHSARVRGAQVAGVANHASDVVGGQVAGLMNIADQATGAQVGALNVARHVTGTQIGLINISDRIDGVPIGLINFERQGSQHFEMWWDGGDRFNFGLRLGAGHLYTLLRGGVVRDTNPQEYSYGGGLGFSVPLSPFFLNFDGSVSQQVISGDGSASWDPANLKPELRLTGGYSPRGGFGVFVGSSFEIEVPGWHLPGDAATRVVPGYFLGVQFGHPRRAQ
jgi:hypothetical protein